ncbi:hypothetical protein CFC21_103329 [Triticum aestivum]|uniref:Non-lysosomal glucosylceramidase n=3 Tax=Triticum TaxID=4564 RepID=A0A9R1A2T3_TRITD|nr:hypothetical protein CFC21_103329 [Triticum aestivum]VAI88490.1 unnamed protein product [Triticum turgidum subsp. durum]
MGPSTPGGRDQFTAKDMWDEVKKHGSFGEATGGAPPASSRPGSSIGAAVASTTTVPAGGTRVVSFALSWSCPEVKFPSGRTYHRRYTKFLGLDRDAAAEKLAHDALLEHMAWESKIDEWQRPILQDKRLPEWYPVVLFNELYYLNAGGTIWTDGLPPKKTSFASSKYGSTTESFTLDGFRAGDLAVDGILSAMSTAEERLESSSAFGTALLGDGEENVGQFLYLEGMEYHMWNTYDVHFYSSFSLLSLFPEIELSLQRDFARAVLLHDPRPMRTLDGVDVPRKVYRDVAATGNVAFASAAWPAVYLAMAYMDQFDRDGDGMVENEGRPDQTFDLWSVSGVSAYTGGLWVAALQAAAAMARIVGDRGAEGYFLERYKRAQRVYDGELWNGSYFDYDNSGGATSKSIMADQLAGQWYARACGLEPIVEEEKARSALGTVLDYNVMRVQGGAVGAVNGMRPDGAVDASSLQSKEVWVGVTYGVAAAMLHEDMPEAAFRTAKGAHDAGWGRDGFGYAFQTPEAWTSDAGGGYRSLHYMRPLSIWAMQWALSPPELHRDLRVVPGSVSAVASPAEVDLAREKFEKVACMLRLPEEVQHKGYLRAIYQVLRQMLLPES